MKILVSCTVFVISSVFSSASVNSTSSPTFDEWHITCKDITQEPSDDIEFLKLNLNYCVGKGILATQVHITLLDETCTYPTELDSIEHDTVEVSPRSEEHFDDAIVKLVMNQTDILNSNVWTNTSEEASDITFCTRAELLYEPNSNLSVSYVDTHVTLSFSMMAGFTISDVTLLRDNATEVSRSFAYTASACICDESNGNTCIPNPIIKQNDPLSICVFPSDGTVEISTFEELVFYQDGVDKYSPILNSEKDSITETVTGVIGVVRTRLISVFYYDENPSQVTISGLVGLAFSESTERSLKERPHDEQPKKEGFNVIIDLEPSSSNPFADFFSSDESDGGNSLLWIVAGFIGVAFVIIGSIFILKTTK